MSKRPKSFFYSLWQAIVRAERMVLRAGSAIYRHYDIVFFPFRFAGFLVYRFRLLPGWAKFLKVLVLIALLLSPWITGYIERYQAAAVLYEKFYPRFYQSYLKRKQSKERARYYASYYAQYYADYYVSANYRVALQYALPEASRTSLSYPGNAPNAGRVLSAQGVALIKRFEGLVRDPYVDAGGKLTIGYGHLVRPNELYTALSEAEAEALLHKDLQVAEAEVKRQVKVGLTPNQYAALVSLVYNIGSGHFEDSRLLRALNGGDYAEAAEQFLRWDNVNGRKLPGLTGRRVAERALFLG